MDTFLSLLLFIVLMRKIAVISSGSGDKTARLVSLFNEGNRFRVSLVLTDRENAEIGNNISDPTVSVVFLPREVWRTQPEQVLEMLRKDEIELVAVDDFRELMPVPLQEEFEGRIVLLSSPEEAPREVVAAFNKMDASRDAAVPPVPESPKSVDEEWADVLKINFDSASLPHNPPPVPETTPERPEDIVSKVNPFMGQMHQARQEPQDRPPLPPTYLVWSVIMTILCCTIPGIVAIVFSSQVTSKYMVGDYEGAVKASRNAEIWIIVSFVLGVLSATLYLPIMLAA